MKTFNIPSSAVPVLDRLNNWYLGKFEPDLEDEPIGVSDLGTPIYNRFDFLDITEKRPLLSLETVLVTVTGTKNIVKTSIPDVVRGGTIKEYISDDDFTINIRGAIVSPYPNKYPIEKVQLLSDICKVKTALDLATLSGTVLPGDDPKKRPVSLPVAYEFLTYFGIEYIVVENLKVSEKLGSRNEVPFEITAISDTSRGMVVKFREDRK